MQFTALGDLGADVFAQDLACALGDMLAQLATVARYALHPPSPGLQRCSACSVSLRSVTSALVTAMPCGQP